MIADGFHDIPPGKVATIVTHLEMTARMPERIVPAPEGLAFERLETPTPDLYRDLMYRVGGHAWLWFSRLALDDAALSAIIHDPLCPLYTLTRNGRAEAMLELDFRVQGECELAFFGVTPTLIGTGAGRFLMNQAIRLAWDHPISRFHVHTCTLDSPGALAFYQRSGFKPIRQQVEITDDPRVTGILPPDAGPHIPVIHP
ncbi:MAG: GNAT family N-acetyltransferase [Paracoccaceae bacterium]